MRNVLSRMFVKGRRVGMLLSIRAVDWLPRPGRTSLLTIRQGTPHGSRFQRRSLRVWLPALHYSNSRWNTGVTDEPTCPERPAVRRLGRYREGPLEPQTDRVAGHARPRRAQRRGARRGDTLEGHQRKRSLARPQARATRGIAEGRAVRVLPPRRRRGRPRAPRDPGAGAREGAGGGERGVRL